MLAVTGLTIAFRGRLDFVTFVFLKIHRGAALVFTAAFLFGFVRSLGTHLHSRRLTAGYPLLCLFFVFLPVTQYLFFQLDYPLAAVGVAVFLWTAKIRLPDGKRRAAIVSITLWLAAVPVMLAGWQILLFPTMRHNFYHLFHRWGALAFALLLPCALPAAAPPRRAARWLHLGAIAAAAAILTGGWGVAAWMSARFPVAEHRGPRPPFRLDLADAAANRPLVADLSRLTPSGACSSRECHKIFYDQWNISPHHLAGRTEPYKYLVRLLIKEKGPQAAVFCSRCHTPLLALAGLADNPDDPAQSALRNEGVSCQYCHIVDEVRTPPANGDVRVQFGRDYLDDLGGGSEMESHRHAFIMADLMPHRNLYRRPVQKETAFCGACHRVDMPAALTEGKAMIVGDTHTPWIGSRSAAQGMTCQVCHMPLTMTRLPQTDYRGYPDDLHAGPDHRFIGTCQALALLVPEERNLTRQYDAVVAQRLLGQIEIPRLEYFYLWLVRDPRLPAFRKYLKGQNPIAMRIAADRGPRPESARLIRIETRNNTFAHVLPSGPLDLNEIWLELTVADGAGKTIFTTPGLDQNQELPPQALRLGTRLLDKNGEAINDHRFWAADRAVDKNILELDRSRYDEFRISVPPDARFPLTVKAVWRYRRYNQRMANAVYGVGRVTFPTLPLVSETITVER